MSSAAARPMKDTRTPALRFMVLISATYQIRGVTVNPSDEGVDDTFVSPDEPISSRDKRRCLDDVFHERVRIPELVVVPAVDTAEITINHLRQR